MKLEEILEEQAKMMKMPGLRLDELGACHFVVNETTAVTIEKSLDGRSFYLHALVATVLAGEDESLFAELLEANLFGKETGAATLAYDAETRSVVLFQQFEEETTDYTQYQEALERFVGVCNHWKEKLIARTEKHEPHYLNYQVRGLIGQQNLRVFFT